MYKRKRELCLAIHTFLCDVVFVVSDFLYYKGAKHSQWKQVSWIGRFSQLSEVVLRSSTTVKVQTDERINYSYKKNINFLI